MTRRFVGAIPRAKPLQAQGESPFDSGKIPDNMCFGT